jgi:hypothetical protein
MGIEALGIEEGPMGIGALNELEALKELGALGIGALGIEALGIGVDIKGFISSLSLYALKFSFFIGTVHLSQFEGLLAVLFNDMTFSIIKYEVKIIHDNKIASYKCTLITYFNITNTKTNITSVLV